MVSDFNLTVLGTASALPTLNRYPSAQALSVRGRLFLIDCGEGAQMQMRRLGISPLKIETICLTHTHGDHVFGVFGLLSTMGMLKRETPLKIFAPKDFGEILDFYKAHFSDGNMFSVDFEPVASEAAGAAGEWPKLIQRTPEVEVYAFPLRHSVETYGYLFMEVEPGLNVRKEAIERYGLTVEEILTLKAGQDFVRNADGVDGGSVRRSVAAGDPCGLGRQVIAAADVTYRPWEPRSFAYCSDTMPFPELAEWVRGVDLLYHEATYPEAMTQMAAAHFHSTTVQAARCAADAGVGRLVVGHYSSRFQDVNPFLDEVRAIFPASSLANEGDSFNIPIKKTFR